MSPPWESQDVTGHSFGKLVPPVPGWRMDPEDACVLLPRILGFRGKRDFTDPVKMIQDLEMGRFIWVGPR